MARKSNARLALEAKAKELGIPFEDGVSNEDLEKLFAEKEEFKEVEKPIAEEVKEVEKPMKSQKYRKMIDNNIDIKTWKEKGKTKKFVKVFSITEKITLVPSDIAELKEFKILVDTKKLKKVVSEEKLED